MYWSQKQWKKIKELKVQIKETKKIFSNKYSDILNNIVNLASTYKNQKQWEKI